VLLVKKVEVSLLIKELKGNRKKSHSSMPNSSSTCSAASDPAASCQTQAAPAQQQAPPQLHAKLKQHLLSSTASCQIQSRALHNKMVLHEFCVSTRVLQAWYLRTVLGKGNQYLSTILVKYPGFQGTT
jgi:hypothetical protein